jgi:parvulin-like peptidyl-prolyl isomerase
MKKTIYLFLILFSLNLNSQNIKEKLNNINTIEEAEKFVSDNPELTPEIFTISPETDPTHIPEYFKTFKNGHIFNKDGHIFKVLSVTKENAFRVSCVYLDGSKLSRDEINNRRIQIISQYREGKKFSDLALEFTMDGNLNGDLSWTEGMMVSEFESAVKVHKKGEIFTVDIPTKKWYYVTLKTHEDIIATVITILKVKSSS